MHVFTIFCGSKDTVHSDSIRNEIRDLLRFMNKEYTIAYGGGTHGLMREIYDSCQENRLKLISVNCNRWIEPDLQYEYELVYPSIIDRQAKLLSIADAYIVCPGGLGTLFETLQAITMNDVNESNKPIFFLNIYNYFEPLFSLLDRCREIGTVNKSNIQLNIHIANCAIECVQQIDSYFLK